MTDESALFILMSCAIAPLLVAWACHKLAERHRPNRRVKRNAWATRASHPSFWSRDDRGHVECR